MLIVVLALFIYFTLSNHQLENETEDLKQQTTKIQEQIAVSYTHLLPVWVMRLMI